MNCSRCQGSGFLNLEQVPQDAQEAGTEAILAWISANQATDAQVCDCCGDGAGWYGDPGRHYTAQDPAGKSGPYAYNGGLAECH
jgi:hypothetical protein